MDARRQSTADGSEALAYVVEQVEQPDGTSGPLNPADREALRATEVQ